MAVLCVSTTGGSSGRRYYDPLTTAPLERHLESLPTQKYIHDRGRLGGPFVGGAVCLLNVDPSENPPSTGTLNLYRLPRLLSSIQCSRIMAGLTTSRWTWRTRLEARVISTVDRR